MDNRVYFIKKKLDGKALEPIHCVETYVLYFKQHLVLTRNDSVSEAWGKSQKRGGRGEQTADGDLGCYPLSPQALLKSQQLLLRFQVLKVILLL